MTKIFLAAALLLSLAVGVGTSAAEDVPTADLGIVSSTTTPSHARVGHQVAFTIAAANNGPDAVGEIDIHADQALNGLEIVAVKCNTPPYPSPDGTFCEFTGPIQPGETASMTVVARVQATSTGVASLTSCVTSFSGPFNDPNSANDCATATVKIVGKS
jgi:hypothetical protein